MLVVRSGINMAAAGLQDELEALDNRDLGHDSR